MIGIYKITNIVNKKVYIGKSKNIKVRIANHLSKLRNNNHYNTYLQNSFNKYGEDNFYVEVIEECNETVLSNREKYFIKKFNSTDPSLGYNLTEGGDGGLAGYKHSKETKTKIGNAQKGELNHMFGKEGYWKTHKIPQEVRDKMSKSAKGKVISKTTREKISRALKGEKNPFYGKTHSEETIKKIKEVNTGENSYWYGRKHSESTKQKMSKNNAKSKKVVFYREKDNATFSFDSIKLASDFFDVKYQTLASAISKKGRYRDFVVTKK